MGIMDTNMTNISFDVATPFTEWTTATIQYICARDVTDISSSFSSLSKALSSTTHRYIPLKHKLLTLDSLPFGVDDSLWIMVLVALQVPRYVFSAVHGGCGDAWRRAVTLWLHPFQEEERSSGPQSIRAVYTTTLNTTWYSLIKLGNHVDIPGVLYICMSFL